MLKDYARYYDENKKLLENTNTDINLFCSLNWDSKNFDNLCEKYNLHVMNDGDNQRSTHLLDVYTWIKKPCI